MMKKRVLILILLCLALTGCRTRTVTDPLLADTVLLNAPEAPPEPTLTPVPTPEATPAPTPEPEPTSEPAETEAPPEPEPAAPSGAAAAVSTGAVSDTGGGQTAAPPVETAAPQPTPEPRKGDATVTFDGNGGRVKSRQAKLTLSGGAPYGELPVPLREGYGFLGWFTAPEDGDAVTGESVFSGEDQTLYAHWEYDPVAFWTFTLQNKTQQVYLCQQTSIYYEAAEAGVTARYVGLISDTGSLNVAENRDDPSVTDDWVRAKKPELILKCLDGTTDLATVRSEVSARFPGTRVALVSANALGSGAYGLYARLALAKQLYGDWYTDVDLSVVAEELGVAYNPILF